jgi:hypothetical protein
MSEEERQESQFEAYMRGMEERMSSRLESTVNEVRQDQAKLAQYIQNGQQLRQAPPKVPDSEAGEKILQEMFSNPVRFFGEVGQISNQQADAVSKRNIEEYARRSQAEAAHREFWDGFAQHNNDVAAFLPMVKTLYDELPVSMNNSARADEAAKRVRELIAARRADAVESDRRQSNQARMTASPSTANDPSIGRAEAERPRTAAESAQNAIADMEDWRSRRMVFG